MNLTDNDVVIGMQIESQGKDMLIVSERGMGKRTDTVSYTHLDVYKRQVIDL